MSFVSCTTDRVSCDNLGWLQPESLTPRALAHRAHSAYLKARRSGERPRRAAAFALLALVQQCAYSAGFFAGRTPATRFQRQRHALGPCAQPIKMGSTSPMRTRGVHPLEPSAG